VAWFWRGRSGVVTGTAGELILFQPATTAIGDLVVAAVSFRGNVPFNNSDSDAAGWALAAEYLSADVSNGLTTSESSIQVWWKIADTAGADVIPLLRTGGSGAGSTFQGRAFVYYSDAGGPIGLAAAATHALSVGSTDCTFPGGITTVAANDLVVFAISGARNGTVSGFDAVNGPTTVSSGNDNTSNPSTTTWAERNDTTFATSPTCALGLGDAVMATPGSLGNVTAIQSLSAEHALALCVFSEVYAPPATVYTLTAAAGSLALAGKAAGLRVSRRAALSPGSFALSGKAAALKRQRPIALAAGALTLTGRPVNLVYSGTTPAAAYGLGGDGVSEAEVVAAVSSGGVSQNTV